MMPTRPHLPYRRAAFARGTTLIEVLVTVVVLAFGLLGIAAFQAKAQVGSIESYQRAQAVVLLEDMHARMLSNPDSLAQYVTSTPLGTGSTAYTSCASLTAVARDKCEWHMALQGAAEVQAAPSTSAATGTSATAAPGVKLGAMIGARGCIEQIQARNSTDGVCAAGIYRITLAWQGMHATVPPSLTCGKDAYSAETARRAIATRVAVGTPECKK